MAKLYAQTGSDVGDEHELTLQRYLGYAGCLVGDHEKSHLLFQTLRGKEPTTFPQKVQSEMQELKNAGLPANDFDALRQCLK